MGHQGRLFVDMDGTLAAFRQATALEELYERGYFTQLPPQQNVVDAVKLLLCTAPDTEIFILSSVLSDSQFARKEKNIWLDQYLPELDEEHRIFLPCGENKANHVPGGVYHSDFLLDDYTKNLEDWKCAGGRGVKLLNGINHTRGSWGGVRIGYDRAPAQIADAILLITHGHFILHECPCADISATVWEFQRTASATTQLQTELDL